MRDLEVEIKSRILEELYTSIERMNQALLDGNTAIYKSEVERQKHLRSEFESLVED